MIQDPVKRSRVKSTLLIVIIATIPCYLLGLIVLWVSNGVRDRTTPTPGITETAFVTQPQPTAGEPTLPVPTAQFPTATFTLTPSITPTLTATRTYVIPTATPSDTPTATFTMMPLPTETDTPVPEITAGTGAPVITDTPPTP